MAWETRRKISHGKDREDSIRIRRQKLKEKIRHVYDTKDYTFHRPEDSLYVGQLFKEKLQHWDNEKTRLQSMQDWIRTYDQAVELWNNNFF